MSRSCHVIKSCPEISMPVKGLGFHGIENILSGGVWAGKEACVLQRREGCRDGLQNSCLCVGSPGRMRTWDKFALQLMARQYGEVVLPDAASGQGPGTLARMLSRCKEGMAHFLPSWYKFY